jgi:hypothetical protein
MSEICSKELTVVFFSMYVENVYEKEYLENHGVDARIFLSRI